VCRKPIILLNFDGFFDPLLQWITLAQEAGFISHDSAAILTIVSDLDQVAEAVQLSSLHFDVPFDDHFDWSVLCPSVSKYAI
jgi:predicted Rossmann-fold nucleotide-binding protein